MKDVSYSKGPGDHSTCQSRTVNLFVFDDGAKKIEVQKVSDFSFSDQDALRVVAQLGSLRQCTRSFCPKESTIIQSTLLLPIEQVRSVICFFKLVAWLPCW